MAHGAFTIDLDPVSCEDFESCVRSGQCSRSEGARVCRHGVAAATLDAATAYCAWRGMRLPSYVEWMRAADGAREAKPSECKTDSKRGVTRCPVVSRSGFNLGFPTYSDQEWTVGTACIEPISNQQRSDVALAIDLLGRYPLGTVTSSHEVGEFRCAKSL